MEKNISRRIFNDKFKKRSFQNITYREDGLILQVHHTIGQASATCRINFISCEYDSFEQLCACDINGNVFIINFYHNKYWMLPIKYACVAMFVPMQKNLIIIGQIAGTLHLLNSQSGLLVGILSGHRNAVKFISFSDNFYSLTVSDKLAIIWDLKSNCQVHQLELESLNSSFKYATLTPVSFNILACFDDDTIHVWEHGTYDILKITPSDAWNVKHVTAFSFTRNGRAMVMGGKNLTLAVISLDSWNLEKIIELPKELNGVRQLMFVPQMFDGGNNKILAILSLKNVLYFFDMDQNCFITETSSSLCLITKFNISPNGKYLSCIYTTGELNIFLLNKVLRYSSPKTSQTSLEDSGKKVKIIRKVNIKNELKDSLDICKLQSILKEYGEYPSEYRALIWKIILKLPENQAAFLSLVSRGYHPSFKNLRKVCPLENKLYLMSLQRTMSALAYWCPLFGQVHNFTLFIFPFTQLFHNDPLINFEIIVTIIINWCQHWFQYFPFPPINVMAMVENVISDQDPTLLAYLHHNSVTSNLFGWQLLETAFSEVLTRPEWRRLWDHILTNHPSFLIISAAAYSIVQRCVLFSFKTFEQFEIFYHNPNAIDISKFINKCYYLHRHVDTAVHPSRYFHNFKELPKGSYPIFTAYPKETINYEMGYLNKLKEEEEKLMKEENEILKKEATQMTQLKKQMRKNEHDLRLNNIKNVYKNVLDAEHNRLMARYRNVAKLQHEMYKNEKKLMNEEENLVDRNARLANDILEYTLDDTMRKQKFEKYQDKLLEERILERNVRLKTQAANIRKYLSKGTEYAQIIDQNALIQERQNEITGIYQKIVLEGRDGKENQISLLNRLKMLDNQLKQVEYLVEKEIIRKKGDSLSNEAQMRIIHLENLIRNLESDANDLTQHLNEYDIFDKNTELEQRTSNEKFKITLSKKLKRSSRNKLERKETNDKFRNILPKQMKRLSCKCFSESSNNTHSSSKTKTN